MDVLEFLKNYWLLILVALIVLVLLVRAMFKLAVLALVIGGVLLIGFGYTPIEVWNWGKGAANNVSSLYSKTVKPLLEDEVVRCELLELRKYALNLAWEYVDTTHDEHIVASSEYVIHTHGCTSAFTFLVIQTSKVVGAVTQNRHSLLAE